MIQRATSLRFHPFATHPSTRCLRRSLSSSEAAKSLSPSLSHTHALSLQWREYLVEFRGALLPNFRYAALQDAVESVLNERLREIGVSSANSAHPYRVAQESLRIRAVTRERESVSAVPVLVYASLPVIVPSTRSRGSNEAKQHETNGYNGSGTHTHTSKHSSDNNRNSLKTHNLQHKNSIESLEIDSTASALDDSIAFSLAQRCALIRRIVRVWGDAPSYEETARQTEGKLETEILPLFSSLTTESAPSWRVVFARFGRSDKMDEEEKRARLRIFSPTLSRLPKKVRLDKADVSMLLLEDCHDFHAQYERQQQLQRASLRVSGRDCEEDYNVVSDVDRRKNSTNSNNNTNNNNYSITNSCNDSNCANSSGDDEKGSNNNSCSSQSVDAMTSPHRVFFGHIVGEGENVNTRFSLASRPYLGTTSMKPLVASVAANQALVRRGDVVLDPFCGTGSVLIACAAQGARVVGSDVEMDLDRDRNQRKEASERTKNANFVRKDGSTQADKIIFDNFDHYGLRDKVLDFFEADAEQWLQERATSDNVAKYDLFDAIISDPPFGFREQFLSSYRSPPAVNFEEYRHLFEDMSEGDDAITSTDGSDSEGETAKKRSDLVGRFSGDPLAPVVLLLELAVRRLRPQGRLVFWLPTVEDVSQREMDAALRRLHTQVFSEKGEQEKLRFVRATAEMLKSGMWRWICVFERS